MVLVGNTDEIFSESGQNFNEDIHLPAQAASVAHRIAFGPNAGQPVRRLKSQTSLWPSEQRLEKLVRYIACPVISDERVIIERPQSIRVRLKSRWADGTESLLFTPSEFLERLVAPIPNKTPMRTIQVHHL
jgi:hypothetical protein